jgi:putative hydroxymethylpyrimidine transport system permease protein
MKLIWRMGSLILMIALVWEASVYLFSLPDFLLPPPSQIAQAFYSQKKILAAHLLPTLIETLLGFSLGILCGAVAGFILAFSRGFNRWFLPLLIASQAIPTFAIAPFLIIWLGYGLASKVAMTALLCFFPIASAFYDGLKTTQLEWMQLAQTMNAKKWRLFCYIRLPAALPKLASGIRIAAVFAPLGAVMGEWLGASRGLGYLMLNANARMQMDVMFAALIVIMIMALLLYFSVDRLLRTLVWWETENG